MFAPAPSWAMVKRELLSTLRGGRSFLILLAFTAGASAYCIVMWPSAALTQHGGGMTSAGYASREIVQTLSRILLYGSLLFVPAYAAGALVTERDRWTYDLLRMTLIKPFGVIVGKLCNALGFFLMLLVGLAPILAVAFYLVGVDAAEVLMAVGLVIATAFSCAAMGLYCSARFRKTITAIAISYVGVILLMVAPLIATFITFAAFNQFVVIRSFEGYLIIAVKFTLPPLALEVLFDGGMTLVDFGVAFLYQVAVTLALLALTLRKIANPFNPPKIELEKPIDDAAELERRRKQFPYYLIDPMRRKKPVEDGRNPMMVRELRWGLLNRGTLYVRVFYAAFLVYFFVGIIASYDARSFDTMRTWLLVQIVMTIVAAPALMANALTKEYEQRNLDVLRMTLLRPRDIILGKLLAGVVSIVPIVVAAILSSLPVIIVGGVRRWDILAMGYTTLTVCALISLSIGLFASLLSRRTTGALAISYVLGAFVFAGLAFGLYWLYARIELMWAYEDALASFFSPITGFLYSIVRVDDAEQLFGGIAWLYWMSNIVASMAFAALMVAASVAGFNRYKMQDP